LNGLTQISNRFFCFKIRENPLKSDLIRVLLPLILLFGSGLSGLG